MTSVTKRTKAVLKSQFAAVLPIFLATTLSVGIALALLRPAAAQESSAPTNIVALPKASDLFPGQDKPGPYVLTWKKLPALSISADYKPKVVVDEKQLGDNDYSWDSENGTITFTTVVKAASMVHIEYPYDPNSSERNPNPNMAPVTLPVLKAGGANLQMTAISNGAAGVKTNQPGRDNDSQFVWQLSAPKMNLLGGGLTTQAYLAPDGRTTTGGENGMWDRSGMSVGYKMGNDKNGIDAGFSRFGREFAPTVGRALHINDTAQQVRSLAARYSLSSWFRTEWKQSDTDYLAQGAGKAEWEQYVIRMGGVGNMPTLNLFRTEDGRTDGNGATSSQTTDRLELAAKLGPKVGVDGSAQQNAKKNPNGTDGEKVTDIAVNLKAQTGKSQTATVAVTNKAVDNKAGTEQANTAVAVTVQASPSVTITAEQNKAAVITTVDGKETTTENEQNKAQAKITLAPGASVQGGVTVKSITDTEKNKVQATSVAAKVGEGKAVELQQTMVTRNGNMAGTATLDTTDTRLALRPVPGLTLSGALTNNPEQNGQVIEAKRQEMGLSARVGALQLGSGYALTETPAQPGLQSGELSFSLGLRFNRNTMLSGQYKDALLYGISDATAGADRGLRVYSFGLQHDMGNLLNFSLGGSMTETKTPGAAPNDYKAEAKLGVKF